MKIRWLIAIVVMLILLCLTAVLVSAENPFVGRWKVDSDRYLITDSHISGIMDGIPYESGYTFTDGSWTWKDRTWLYHVIDPDHIFLIGILQVNGIWAVVYWRMSRDESPQQGKDGV